MRTYLDLVNAVMRRLREDEVTTVSANDYSKLITDFVKEAVQEVESASEWNALRQSILVTTTSGVYAYTLTGTGTEYAIHYAHVDGDDYDLVKAPSSNWMTHQYLSDSTNSNPLWYDINGVDSNGDPIVNVFPIPDAAYNIYFAMKIRTTDDPVDTTPVYLPERPIILRAYQFALEERGDSGSDSLALIESRYQRALADAVGYDRLLNEDESIWTEE